MGERWDPVADAASVVLCNAGGPDRRAVARFTILTDRLIRMEWSPEGRFEDRASQVFVNRRLPTPRFRVERNGTRLTIITARLRLLFFTDGKAFHRGNLSVEFEHGGAPKIWRAGDPDLANLGGTTRTLDGVPGACPVEPGLLSRDGWVVVDDSHRLVFEPGEAGADGVNGWDWPTRRGGATESTGAMDWYFFGYSTDYKSALRDYALVAGRVPLPPRFVFGAWWSRYWAYAEEELIALVEEFHAHGVPLDVLVIDMDWHLKGWTGYTWNREYFPDPERFLEWTDRHGLQITLNLHPADGVGPHESAYREVCADLGLDHRRKRRIPFDCTDRRFVESYFKRLHRPLEEMGVDFWWMDWQQGLTTPIEGLDPLWWLNHLHWEDLRRRQRGDPVRRGRRPLIFSRWGGLGNHRYPIGFSGDTFSTWRGLAWQPEFTAMAGNVGYGYWSHDIGGHQPGPVEPELYARWVQFGVLSPVLRTHTSKNPLGERRIWASPQREFRAMREAFRLRYALIPYIYTAARACFDDAIPLCRPLYLEWPRIEESYRRPNQYLFGEDLLAAPVTTPGDRTSRSAACTVWFPPGVWIDWFTGERFVGLGERLLLVPIDRIPLFARAGAIIPAAPPMRWSDERALDPLILHIFPGAEGTTRVYEDDGESAGYESGACRWTPVQWRRSDAGVCVTIGPAEGELTPSAPPAPPTPPTPPAVRGYEVRLRDRWPARRVLVDGRPLPSLAEGKEDHWWYDHDELSVVVRLAPRQATEEARIEVTPAEASDGPLSLGLRGRIRTLERVAALLGDATPASVTGALRGVPWQGSADEGYPDRVGAIAGFDMYAAAREARRRIAPGAELDEALCLLLGVACRIEIAADDTAPRSLRARAEAWFAGAAPGRKFGVELEPSRPWRRIGAVESRRTITSGPEIVAREEVWETEPILQHTTIRALVRVDDDIELTFAESLLPSINGWWVVGPFHAPFTTRQLDRVFDPEREQDLTAVYKGKGGRRIGWKRALRTLAPGDDPRGEHFVNFHSAFGHRSDNAVAYAMTLVEAPRSMPARLALGSDDGVVVWVNGEEVHRLQAERGFGSRQDRVPITLRAGTNRVLLKVGQARGAWGFAAHIESPEGLPLPELMVRLDEPPTR